MNQESRTILIAGGSRGIGRATLERLATENTNLIFTSRSLENAIKIAEPLAAKTGSSITPMQLDQSNPMSVRSLMKSIFDRFGKLDGMVLNAGVHKVGRIGMITEEDLEELWQTNSAGILRLIQSGAKLLRRGHNPSIVILGSIMASSGVVGQAAYAMSKAAVSGLAVPASRELAVHGIRVNVVSPGYVETEMINDLEEAQRAEIIRRTPLGRFAKPEEVASVVSFLLSSESLFITGQEVRIDGGLRD